MDTRYWSNHPAGVVHPYREGAVVWAPPRDSPKLAVAPRNSRLDVNLCSCPRLEPLGNIQGTPVSLIGLV